MLLLDNIQHNLLWKTNCRPGNSYTKGGDKYSNTLPCDYKILVNWNQDTRNSIIVFKEEGTNGNVDFTNVGYHESYEGVSLANPINKANIFYFGFQLKVNYTNEYITQLFMEEIFYNSE